MDTNLPWNAMWLIGMLPNLEVLKLICAIALDDRMWEPSKEGFRQLKRLQPMQIEFGLFLIINPYGFMICSDEQRKLEMIALCVRFNILYVGENWEILIIEIGREVMSSEAMEMIASVFVPNILLCGKLEIHHQWQRRDLYRACHYTFDRSESTLPKYLAEAVAIRDVLSWVKTRETIAEFLHPSRRDANLLDNRDMLNSGTTVSSTTVSSTIGTSSTTLQHRQMQMAYAAVTSLKGTLHLHFLQSQPRLPLIYKPKMVSLHRNLSFLQESLEKSEMDYDDAGAMKDLEAEIRDAAFEAEERIEMELTSIYLEAKGWTKRVACLLRLHEIFTQAVKQTDYLKKKLIKIKTEKQLAKCSSQEFFEHWNMQSFIVHGALDSFEAYGIWKMPLLRNFCIQRIDSLGTLSVVLTHLQSISWLNSKLCTEDLFTMIPNLKKLGVCDRYDENNQDCFYSFEHLGQLEELRIRGWYFNHIPCSNISWATGFLPNLKKLKFFLTSLAWSDMRLIGLLPNLEVLKLKHAIDREDKMWETSEEGFRKLKRLVIEYEWLEHWSAESDHFPLLECLEICECKYLREIPSGFADITTLALIQLNMCSDSVLDSTKSIQEEQNNYGKDFLVRLEMGVDKYRFLSFLKL
nr:putative late blight resistance protein homolog R1A-4 [Ipomoea batatas]